MWFMTATPFISSRAEEGHVSTTTLTYTDLIVRFPEFAVDDTTAQTRISLFVTDAAYDINATHFGGATDRAVLTLACHNLSMANRANETAGGGAGAVSARSRGEHIVSYSVPTKGDGYERFRTTNYGMMYLSILRNLSLTPFVTGA
jgi:hypothetical protein